LSLIHEKVNMEAFDFHVTASESYGFRSGGGGQAGSGGSRLKQNALVVVAASAF
jgi:hypothetical protein